MNNLLKIPERENNFEIKDNFNSLNLMVKDSKNLDGVYQPGPHWIKKTKKSLYEIKKYGLSDFRGMKSTATTSFGDNAILDLRNSYKSGAKVVLSKFFRNIYPFNKFFDKQVSLTKDYFFQAIEYKTQFLKKSDRVKFLLSKYDLSFETTNFGCLSYGDFDGKIISHYYLQMLDTLDIVNQWVDIKNKNTFLEIGGGFGVNTHLIIELFEVRKIIYMDLAPNLHVGTEYLKSFYGKRVMDYTKSRDLDQIKFSDTNELQIICIAPHQIEKIDSKIDFFHSAHSFQEMPEKTIKNYAKKIEDILSNENGVISLVSYESQGTKTVLNPDILPSFFNKSYKKKVAPTLSPNKKFIHHFIE